MTTETHEKNLSVKIDVKTLAILDKLKDRADISRSKLVNNIIETTIDELDMGRRIGFFQMVILIRNVSQKISGTATKDTNKDLQEGKTIPVRLSEEYQQKLKQLAKITDRSPHYLMKNFIQVGAEELDSMLIKPIIPLAIVLRDLKEKIDALCNKGEKAMASYMAEPK